MANKKCPLCKLQYDNIDSLAGHIESEHGSEIPKDWSGGKYYFYRNNGRFNGSCVICKSETTFNETTCKPNRFCNNPKCKDIYREDFRKRMIKVYKTDTLLNDPNHQKKMLNNRSIAKDYKWSDGTIKRAIGSYEYDGCQFMDIFMQFESNDVILPAPQIILYTYEGEEHMYIPDAFIASLNLLVEFKDGGDNPNMHPKIQRVDKKKEKAKEAALTKYGFNYIKIENKQYGNFVNLVNKLRNMDVISGKGFSPIIITNEMTEILLESSLEPKIIKLVIFRDEYGLCDYVGLYINGNIYSYNDMRIYKYSFDKIKLVNEYEILFNDYEFKDMLYDNIDKYINVSLDVTHINNVNFPIAFIYELHKIMGTVSKCFITQSIDEYDIYDTYEIEHLSRFDFIRTGVIIPKIHDMQNNLHENVDDINYMSVGEYKTYLETIINIYNNKRMEFMRFSDIYKELTMNCLDLIDTALNNFEIDAAKYIIPQLNKLFPYDNDAIPYAIDLLDTKKEMISAINMNLNIKDGGLIKIDPLKIHRNELAEFDNKYNSFGKRFADCLGRGIIDYDLICERDEYLNQLDESVSDSELYYLGINSI